ncbi:MAG: T9SS type A sorting domain-containing protein [Bacteroidota bacterium]
MNYFSRLLLLGLSLLSFNLLSAQVCIPDSSFTAGGTYPDSIPGGCANEFYEAVITVVVPADTVLGGFTVPIDSVILEDVLNGPPNMTLACEPTGCVFPGNSIGCGSYSGTPTMATTYLLDLVLRVHVNTPFGPLVVVDTVEDFYTLEISDGPQATSDVTGASCGASDGSASVTPTAGTGPYTYSWSTGDLDSAISNLAAGAYDVDITDASGCMQSLTVNVPSVGGNAPVIDSSASVLSWSGCHDDLGGAIDVAVSGGTGSLAYTWTNGDTTQNVGDLGAGSYTLTVTDDAGCVSSETFVLDAPAPLVATPDQQDVTCNGDADGSASAAVSGGESPYTFSWSTGGSDNVIDGLSGGTYTAYITDDIGCNDTAVFDIFEPEVLILNLTGTSGSGNGAANGSAVAAPTGGTAPYIYTWSNGDTTAAVDSLAPGSYTLTVTDANNCVSEQDVTIGGAVSISDEFAAGISALNIYPNPNRGSFTLQMELAQRANVQVDILDLQGRVLHAARYASTQQVKDQITRDDLAAGLYMLRIRTEKGQALRRLVIE